MSSKPTQETHLPHLIGGMGRCYTGSRPIAVMATLEARAGMRENPVSVLVVASPGPLQDGLRALMRAMPQVEVVYEANDLSLALNDRFDSPPTLVLLDGDLANDEVRLMVEQVRARWPKAGCIFLCADVRQQEDATVAGADTVVLKGFPAPDLVTLVVNMLLQEQETRPCVAKSMRGGRPWKSCW